MTLIAERSQDHNSTIRHNPSQSQIPVPEGFRSAIEIARYQAWLEGAYCAAISDSVRQLIADVYDELSAVSASGVDAGNEFGQVIRAAVQSVSAAIECDAATRL